MSSKPTVYILGCYHQLQEHPSSNNQSDGKTYSTALEDLLKNVHITFIGEEAGGMNNTFARRLALQQSIKYEDLDLPPDARNLIRHLHEEEPVMNKEHTEFAFREDFPEYRRAWGLVREFHMYKTFEKLSKGHSISMLICGLKHVKGFQALLK